MPKKLATEIGRLLKKNRRTLAIAESCTGGLVSSAITDVPGSSDYFLGAVVAYHDRVKASVLGVSKKILHRYGAVSPQTALKLAETVRKKLRSDYGLAVTGIAGPSGGTKTKPVGLVYVGLASKEGSVAKKFIFPGDRRSIRNRAAQKALSLLKIRLLSKASS